MPEEQEAVRGKGMTCSLSCLGAGYGVHCRPESCPVLISESSRPTKHEGAESKAEQRWKRRAVCDLGLQICAMVALFNLGGDQKPCSALRAEEICPSRPRCKILEGLSASVLVQCPAVLCCFPVLTNYSNFVFFFFPFNSMRYFDRAALFVEACLKYGAFEVNDDTNILFLKSWFCICVLIYSEPMLDELVCAGIEFLFSFSRLYSLKEV